MGKECGGGGGGQRGSNKRGLEEKKKEKSRGPMWGRCYKYSIVFVIYENGKLRLWIVKWSLEHFSMK